MVKLVATTGIFLNRLLLLAVFEAQDVPPFRFVIRGVRSSDLGQTWAATRQLATDATTLDGVLYGDDVLLMKALSA